MPQEIDGTMNIRKLHFLPEVGQSDGRTGFEVKEDAGRFRGQP